MYANNLAKKQWSYMILELKSSYHYLMGIWATNIQVVNLASLA